MKVILAENAGFCMGVRRAVETTLDMVRKGDKIATFGPLIHNPQVLGLLEERGVETLHEIPDHRDGTIIIRAHGVPPESKDRLRHTGAKVHDATCPRVLKVQAIIRKHQKDGYAALASFTGERSSFLAQSNSSSRVGEGIDTSFLSLRPSFRVIPESKYSG